MVRREAGDRLAITSDFQGADIDHVEAVAFDRRDHSAGRPFDAEARHLLPPLAAVVHVGAADVMRPRALRRVVMMLRVVVMRPVMRMVGRVHHAVAHVNRWRPGAMIVVQMKAVMFNVIAMASHVRPVLIPGGERLDAEVLALHWTTSFTHAVALADRAAFPCDFVPGSMARVFWHLSLSFRVALDTVSDCDCLPLRLAGIHLAPDILRECLTRGAFYKWHRVHQYLMTKCARTAMPPNQMIAPRRSAAK